LRKLDPLSTRDYSRMTAKCSAIMAITQFQTGKGCPTSPHAKWFFDRKWVTRF